MPTARFWGAAMSPDTHTGDEAAGQDAFAHALLNPEAETPSRLARANRGDPREAFNVYRNNVMVSLVDALLAAFPVTGQMMGEGLSKALFADYVRAERPSSPVLAHYGETVPSFLAEHPATKARPFLADMARLERLKLDSYHAADADALDGSALAAIPPDQLAVGGLAVHPATRLMGSRFPIASMFALESAAIAGEDVSSARQALDIRQGEAVLIARPAFDVMVQAISHAAAAFFTACADGISFEEAATAGFEVDDSFDLQAALALGLTAGVFSSFVPTPNRSASDGQS